MNQPGPSTEHGSLELMLYSRVPGECGIDFIYRTLWIWGFFLSMLQVDFAPSVHRTIDLASFSQIVTIFWSCLTYVTPRLPWLIFWVI